MSGHWYDGEAIGFTVVEYNQASQRPDLPTGATVCDDIADAQAELDGLAEATRKVGRGERYRVCALIPIDEKDEA